MTSHQRYADHNRASGVEVYEAVTHKEAAPGGNRDAGGGDIVEEREESRRRMDASYRQMMANYAAQRASLADKPAWTHPRRGGARAPSELTVTHVNQTKDLFKTPAVVPKGNQSSIGWLNLHGIDHLKLNLKDLVAKGTPLRPSRNETNGKTQQHIQFEAAHINEFEYQLNKAIETYTRRIKWLLQGSRKIFGLIGDGTVGVLVDVSDANTSFGRLNYFQQSLMHLIDEQLGEMRGLYLASFGSEVKPLWHNMRDVNCRILEESTEWVNQLQAAGGCDVLKAFRHIVKVKNLDKICLIVGSIPDQSPDVLCDYVEQLLVGSQLPIHAVAYDCHSEQTHVILKRLVEQSGGTYHCYDTSCEENMYCGTDIDVLLVEIKKAQRIINQIHEMRHGLLGTAIVSLLNEISTEIEKMPQGRFLPQPVGHDLPLEIEVANFQPSSSSDWLAKHGLKAKGLDLYQVLAPNAYACKEEFIPVIRKTVHSQVHQRAMAQFAWHDGSVRNVHVDMAQLFEYQKQLGATVRLYEQRLDWLSTSSRRIFGTVAEKNVLILVDVSSSNVTYLTHIQHSLRLLLQQQMTNKDYFNVIAFSSSVKRWRPTLVKPTPENLQDAWSWILNLHCEGSRNFMAALRLATENEQEASHHIEVEGLYLFTSGIPDQPFDVCVSYLEEACAGHALSLSVILFNVDDYDSRGAIPSHYANITKTAECLRAMAHCSRGRFHWFRETGIIESDDIAEVSHEIDKALNFSKKCSMLVDSVKEKYNLDGDRYREADVRLLPGSHIQSVLPHGTTVKALLQPPKHTALSQARMKLSEASDGEESVMKPLAWRPSSTAKRDEQPTASSQRPRSAKDPMQRVKVAKKAFFYTEQKNGVGMVFQKYPAAKSVKKMTKFKMIKDKEDQTTSKEWLKMFSLSKLKLDLNKLVSGPDCKHVGKPVKSLHKTVEARTCSVFPTINVAGTLRHLQLLPHELSEYEDQISRILCRYLKRLQWLLNGSRRVFGTVVEKQCVFLIDTSGSMEPHMELFKQDLSALIWHQLYKYQVKFNLINFSDNCDPWRPSLMEATEENCHDAVKWVASLVAGGNTCTLEALEMALREPAVEGVYLVTDGKPDCSTSHVLQEVSELNADRQVAINTISFNCQHITANNFLMTLAQENGGRFHYCQNDFDAELFIHTLLEEGFHDHEYPQLPQFEGEDLKKIAAEISRARRYISQCRSYRSMYEELKKKNEQKKNPTNVILWFARDYFQDSRPKEHQLESDAPYLYYKQVECLLSTS